MTTNIESVESLIENRKVERKLKKKKRFIKIFIGLLVHSLVASCIFAFITLNWDALKSVEIRGNTLLSNDEVLSLLNMNEHSLLDFGPLKTQKLIDHPTVKSVKIEASLLQNWVITLEEYRPLAQLPLSKLLLENGTSINYDKPVDVPLIEGYSSVEYLSVAQALSALDPSTLVMISSIQKSPKSFDDQYAHVYMQDGIQVDSSLKTLTVLNDYFSILSVLNPLHRCIAIDEVKSVPYSFPCTQSEQ